MQRGEIKFVWPNYLYVDNLDSSSVMIDVGCGLDADLSVSMIKKYGLRSFGVDPTKKYAKQLEEISEKTKGRFKFIPVAVSAEGSRDSKVVFHESVCCESGSIFRDHRNIEKFDSISYKVESLDLEGLLSRLGLDRANYLKLDLEGAEYKLLRGMELKTLEKFDQIFVEFHHHCIFHYDSDDTKDAIERLQIKGVGTFAYCNRSCLFLPKIKDILKQFEQHAK